MSIAFFIRALCWVAIVTWILAFLFCVEDHMRNPHITRTPPVWHTIITIISVVALLTL